MGSVAYSVLNIPCRPPGGRHRGFCRIFGGRHITPHSPLVATCFALPFIIAACSALIIGSHLFHRSCRHSPSVRPYKIPHPLAFIRRRAARKKGREGKEERRRDTQTNQPFFIFVWSSRLHHRGRTECLCPKASMLRCACAALLADS